MKWDGEILFANTVDKRVIRSHVHIRQLEAIKLEMINWIHKTEEYIISFELNGGMIFKET